MMRYLLLCVVASFCLAPHPAGAAELYDRDGQPIDITVAPTWPAPPGLRRQPVLFVHGHADDTIGDPNYMTEFLGGAHRPDIVQANARRQQRPRHRALLYLV